LEKLAASESGVQIKLIDAKMYIKKSHGTLPLILILLYIEDILKSTAARFCDK
jgi:hypothetical protein